MQKNQPGVPVVPVARFTAKREVVGRMVMIMSHRFNRRGLELTDFWSRAIRQHDIEEVIFTDELDAAPGKRVERVAYLGFFETTVGGIIYVGDQVQVQGKVVGKVAGFDLTHAPNHLNIVVVAENCIPGSELGVALEAPIVFLWKPST